MKAFIYAQLVLGVVLGVSGLYSAATQLYAGNYSGGAFSVAVALGLAFCLGRLWAHFYAREIEAERVRAYYADLHREA